MQSMPVLRLPSTIPSLYFFSKKIPSKIPSIIDFQENIPWKISSTHILYFAHPYPNKGVQTRIFCRIFKVLPLTLLNFDNPRLTTKVEVIIEIAYMWTVVNRHILSRILIYNNKFGKFGHDIKNRIFG